MKNQTLAIWMALVSAVALQAAPADLGKPVELQLQAQAGQDGKAIKLIGADSRQQLVATAKFAGGALRDYAREVSYTSAPAGIVQVDAQGLVTPLANGTATITATSKEGLQSALSIQVEKAKEYLPINFANQIVPIFTKGGCNSGGCHGKSGGQNGFRLSLLGFEPQEDYEYLVKESRGRRLSPAAPEQSLLVQKAASIIPHGGGKRVEPGSYDYKLLVRWIGLGAPLGNETDPKIASIEVFPKSRTLEMGKEQQLTVTAVYSDGSRQDVTHAAVYEANDKEVGEAQADGKLKLFDQPGDVAVMVRYQAKVGVFQATVPLGAPIAKLPAARNFIDEIVFRKLVSVGMPASDVCDDATFLRRTSLDIAGRLPTGEESREFLASKDPAKRDRWVDTLLASTDYADFFANKWAALLRNKRENVNHTRGTFAFHGWIRDSFAANKPYDQFAREILAASGDMSQNPAVAWYRQAKTAQTQMEDTAQLFLGTRLQCAQCHHHPYEKWSQQDYYSFTAFFSQVARKPGAMPGEEVVFHRRGVARTTNKKNNQSVAPAGLGEKPLDELSADDDPRQALADWMAQPSNRFFAHTLVNRYWKHFMNRGLVEPEDDMRETNPAINPELLDSLAQNFIKTGFDMKGLIRAICTSTTYQLSAVPNEHNARDRHYFARYYPKRLTAEVLFDSVDRITGSQSAFDSLPAGTRAVQLPDNSYNAASYFLTVFGRPDSSSSCECERSSDASLAQSLHLLNSRDIQTKLAASTGTAARLAKDTRPDEERVRELYLMAFSREPGTSEVTLATEHIKKKTADKKDAAAAAAKQEAFEDVIWALFNTKEFLFNH